MALTLRRRQAHPTPGKGHRRCVRGAALTAAAGILALCAAPAAQASPSPLPSCSPDVSGSVWRGWTGNRNGSAVFEEYGEILTVRDYSSDGKRTVAYLWYCTTDSNGNAYYKLHPDAPFDSGPNDGDTDTQRYDLSFREGRDIFFQVCTVGPTNCGSKVRAQA